MLQVLWLQNENEKKKLISTFYVPHFGVLQSVDTIRLRTAETICRVDEYKLVTVRYAVDILISLLQP